MDLSENAWDAETLAEMVGGPESNPSRIWDGRDQPEVTYPNWGTGEDPFTLDRVKFTPPLPERHPSGPEAWVPMIPSATGSAGKGATGKSFPPSRKSPPVASRGEK